MIPGTVRRLMKGHLNGTRHEKTRAALAVVPGPFAAGRMVATRMPSGDQPLGIFLFQSCQIFRPVCDIDTNVIRIIQIR